MATQRNGKTRLHIRKYGDFWLTAEELLLLDSIVDRLGYADPTGGYALPPGAPVEVNLTESHAARSVPRRGGRTRVVTAILDSPSKEKNQTKRLRDGLRDLWSVGGHDWEIARRIPHGERLIYANGIETAKLEIVGALYEMTGAGEEALYRGLEEGSADDFLGLFPPASRPAARYLFRAFRHLDRVVSMADPPTGPAPDDTPF